MPYSALLADRIRQALARRRGIEEKTMFGGIGFLLKGNMCVGVWKQSLIVRLDPDQHAEALSAPHAKPFDVTGRPMTGWLLVEPEGVEDDADLKSWIDRAIKFVAKLPAK